MKRMTIFFTLSLIIALVLGSLPLSPAFSAAGEGKSRVIIQYVPNKGGALTKALASVGAQVHYSFPRLNAVAATVSNSALAGLKNNPNVAFVEEDAPRYPISVMRSAAAVAPVGQTVPYGIDMVKARDVWDANRDGVVDAGAPTASNRKICIIDSGFYTGHEDLQGVSVSGYNGNLPWNVDGSGHGTHVAGTITAVNNSLGVLGVTPGTVQIYSVRVFGDDGAWAYSSSLVDAANRCASAGSNIISMSLGGSTSSVTERNAFANLYSQGILSIAAAGNDGTTGFSYPASYDSVVSVAAIDSNKVVADFSQKNSQVEVAAPGVGVLSSVPYIDASSLTAGATTYTAGHIEFSARGTASGVLVNGGLCDTTNTAWSGKIVLCQRGTVSFLDKVNNAKNSGGLAVAIYNNVSGGFTGTMGAGNSSTIVGISLSMEDGQALVASSIGSTVTIASSLTQPASGYEYYDGTSMATPHVSAVAALVWSSRPSASNAQVRAALTSTAEDLGTVGRDTSYGYGLVNTTAAISYLSNLSIVTASVKDLDAVKALAKASWKVTVTITVKNSSGAAVSGAVVAGNFNGTAVSCTTGSTGQCSVSVTTKNTVTSITYTVTNVTATGYNYNAAGNSDPDGDSNGTSITVAK